MENAKNRASGINKCKIAVALFLCSLGGMLVWYIFISPSVKGSLSLNLIGFSDDKRTAHFSCTNQGDRAIEYTTRIEVKTESGWPAYLPQDESFVGLKPRQGNSFFVSTPSAGSTWRLVVCYIESTSKRDERIAEFRQFLNANNMNWAADILPSGKTGYRVWSPEFKN